MNIAQVCHVWESVPPKLYGGTEGIVSYLTEELVRLGHDVARLASGSNSGFGTVADTIAPIRRTTHPQAVALWIFAGLAAIASVLVFGQALARQLAMDASDNAALRALGMSRGQLLSVALVRAGAIAAGATAIAIGIAVAASTFMPIGLARVTASEYGQPAPGQEEARKLLKV